MKIDGLSSDLYLINNPIWIDVSEIGETVKYLEITITDKTISTEIVTYAILKVYNYGSTASYNLQEIIKGNFPQPKFVELLEGGVVYANFRKLDISIRETISAGVYGDTQVITKTFIRGGIETQQTNIHLSIGEKLQHSTKIPQWGGYPTAQYSINSAKQIVINRFITDTEFDKKKVVGCKPLYVKFLNSKGGYSHWLFESFTKNVSVSSLGVVDTREGGFHLGTKAEYSLNAESRVKALYYDLLKSLLKSPEVYVYQQYGLEWARVSVGDNNLEENNFEDMQKVSVQFDINLNENPSLIW